MSDSEQIVSGVSAAKFHRGAGLWVTDEKRSIGLIEYEGQGGYLAIYADTTRGDLPLAITAEGVQLAQPTPHGARYRFIAWDDLYDMVAAHKAKKVPEPC